MRKLLPLLLLLAIVGCKSAPTTNMPPEPKRPPAPPASRAVSVDPVIREQARNVLTDGLTANESLIRSHAIEAMKQVMPDQTQAFVTALKDKAVVVRFAGAMAAGELKIADAKPQLEKMVDEPDGRTKAAALYALFRLGDFSRTRELEPLTKHPLAQVRSVTALVIGMIGDESGLKLLRPMQRDKEGFVRLQVAESMWRLGDEMGRDTLIGASMSRFADDQLTSTLSLGVKPEDPVARKVVYANLTAEYLEVQLVAARVMGQMGSDAGYAIASGAVDSKDMRQRQLAAFALGAIGRPDAQDLLRKLLDDPEQEVQIAAALAVLQLHE
jgi:HEAT repeat protein